MNKQSLSSVAIWVTPSLDNVAIAKSTLPVGLEIDDELISLKLKTNIPKGHRFATTEILANTEIRQYGQPFALSSGIHTGELISESNTTFLPKGSRQINTRNSLVLPPFQGDIPTFQGFLRPDGLTGTRNWVVVIPTSMCSSHEAKKISEIAEQSDLFNRKKWNNVDGVTCIPHTFGCGCMDVKPEEAITRLGEFSTTLTMFKNVIQHPNVGAVLLVELGCEKTNLSELTKWITGQSSDPTDLPAAVRKPVQYISIQEQGGTKAAILAGLSAVESLLVEANQNKRQTLPLEKLVLGLKCGGSDSFSGITANPALGEASDLLIRAGGNSLISEIPEFFGVEHLFASRAVNEKIESEVYTAIERYRSYLLASGGNFEDNPSPGNRAGGLLNITIKAIGAVAKSGHAPLVGVLNYLETIWKHPERGLYLLYGPGYDQISTPALVASGAQLICFTTGRGTGIGNAIAPVIKIASNPDLIASMGEDMDIDAGKILSDNISVQTVGEEIFQKIIRVASGELVKAEETKHREFNIWSEEKVTL